MVNGGEKAYVNLQKMHNMDKKNKMEEKKANNI